MDDFGTLVFLLFVLWPVIAGLLRRGQGTRPPGRAGGRPHAGQRPPSTGGPPADEEPQTAAPVSAADMIPDELWEILTGERRRPAPVRPPQPPVPAPVEAEQAEWSPASEGPDLDEAEWDEEEPDDERWEPALPPRPAVPLEVEPVIVSLEESEPSTGERRAASHAKIAAPVMLARPRRRMPVRLNLGDRGELRRMMILREVLGPPKGLE